MSNKEQFIEDNMNLVYYFIQKYYPHLRYDEDIIQCGMIGLCRAAEKWEQKGEFSSYATKWVLGEIKHELRNRSKWSVEVSLERLLEEKPNE